MEYSTLDSSDGLFTDGEESTVDYEDLDTFSKEEVSGATRSRVEWAQRLLVALRVLTIIHIVLNLRLLILSWTLYSVLGRFFAMLPFALEIVLALVFEALGTSSSKTPLTILCLLHFLFGRLRHNIFLTPFLGTLFLACFF